MGRQNGSESAPSGDDQVLNALAHCQPAATCIASALGHAIPTCHAYQHRVYSARICVVEAASRAIRVSTQERAAWEGVAEELLRKDPAAAARFEKLAAAERRVSELMVPLLAAVHCDLRRCPARTPVLRA